MDPLELLPAELWRMIFERVEDGQDWLNLCRASSATFEGVVGEEKPQALIAKVFPHLQQYLEEDLNGLLSLRLVSRHWKKAVDTTLETSECKFSDERREFSDLEWKYSLENAGTISKFLDKFSSTHPGNPFIGGFVRFIFDPYFKEDMNMELRHSVERVMDRFGKHIRKLCIWADIGYWTSLDSFLIQFRSCMELAPNLEELTVQVYGRNGVDLLLDNPVHGNQPLTTNSKLKSFYLTGNGLPVGLQNILVGLCCNPETLRTAEMAGVPMELTNFPNLEAASVKVTRAQEDVSNLINSSWPLTRLALCHGDVEFPRIPMDATIVECLEHFKGTLTSLWIGSKCTPDLPEDLEQFLVPGPDLPQLKYLSMSRRLMSVQFVRNLPRLEELRILEHDSLYDEDCVERLFVVVENQLSEDKIWEVLPKLRELKLIGRRYCAVEFRLKRFCKVYGRE